MHRAVLALHDFTLPAIFLLSVTLALGCGIQNGGVRTPGQDDPARPAIRSLSTPPAQAGGPSSGGRDGNGASGATPLRLASPSRTSARRPTAAPNQPGTPTPAASRLTGARSVPPSPRYEPLPLKPDAALEGEVKALLGANLPSYGVAVKRLADGRGIAINADRQFYAASLYKLLVMYEVFKQRGLGLLSFDEELTLTPPYLEFQIGEPPWPLWSKIPIRELLEAMITESDNVAAMLLHDKVGGWNIIQDLKAIGLANTDIAGEMPTSARDMAMLLELIARGKAVDQAASEEMVELLSRQKIRSGLPSSLPAGTRVANKTGNWENATHDVGIVFAPGGAYTIAVLSDRAWESKPIAAISRLAYDRLENTPVP